jgi:cytoplasmic iron level regulating protein YaaA (DUF328/UPF0246 family)
MGPTIIFSPTKTLDFDYALPAKTAPTTEIVFQEKSDAVAAQLQSLSKSALKQLLGVSDKLVGPVFESYKAWGKQKKRAAILAMKGPSLVRLDPLSLPPESHSYLADHLRILDGQYGCLRPFDAIQNFRCPMETKVEVQGKKICTFWEEDVCKHLFDMGGDFILNIASQEYAKVAKPLRKKVPFVDVKFLTKGSSPSVYGKQGRGAMLRFCAESKVKTIEDVKKFDYDGYAFSEAESTESSLVFQRSSAPKKQKK